MLNLFEKISLVAGVIISLFIILYPSTDIRDPDFVLVLTILSLTHFIEKSIKTYHMNEVNYEIIFHNGSNGAYLMILLVVLVVVSVVIWHLNMPQEDA